MLTLHRRRLRLLMGAALLAFSAVFYTSPAQGAYTLTLAISDNLGNSATFGPVLSVAGVGAATYIDLGVTFPEFSSLSILATALETAGSSFLNKVDISGAVLSSAGSINLFVTLTGSGFTMPVGTVTAIQGLSSSSAPGTFTSAGLTGTLDGTTVATQTIGAPGATSTTKPGISVTAPYSAVLSQNIMAIASSFNQTSSLVWATGGGGGPVPVPPTMVLALTGVIGIGLSRLRRFRWKDFAAL